MELKPYVKGDYDFCFDLYKSNMISYTEKHWNGWEDSFFTKNFHQENVMMIEVDGSLVGFYEIEIKEELGLIHDIQLVKEYIGKGIGTEVISLIEKDFISKGVKTARLKVFVDNPAVKLYSRLGYKETKKSNSVGTIVMEKEL